MDSVHFTSDIGEHVVVVTRVEQTQWHAVEDGRVVGRGEASRRPDGRLFLSADVWHDAVFDALIGAMLTVLPKPLYTVVDEVDLELTANWVRAGFTVRRREWEYLVPTTGLGSVSPPAGVTILAEGEVDVEPLRALDLVIRDEVQATVGWREMPAEVLPRPAGVTVLDPSRYVVAAQDDQYVGLVRVAAMPRWQPRIGLIAVRADQRRRGIARSLLAHTLGLLRGRGIDTASAEVNESNVAAAALFDGAGARRAGSNLELVFA